VTRWLASSTIKRKLTLIIMLTCCVALVLACAAILFFEIAGTRQILKHNTQVMADVIGANSSAALSFKDKTAAKETLAALRAAFILRRERFSPPTTGKEPNKRPRRRRGMKGLPSRTRR